MIKAQILVVEDQAATADLILEVLKGEGYVDIPPIESAPVRYNSKLDFRLETALVGDSEMQHLDFAYASSLIRTFCGDPTLVLTIRGRKYTPHFNLLVGGHQLSVQGVQTEVDAGYEGRSQVVLIEAKNGRSSNVIARQLFYPYRQWQSNTRKLVHSVFFEKMNAEFLIWEFVFDEPENYHSARLIRSGRYIIATPNTTTPLPAI